MRNPESLCAQYNRLRALYAKKTFSTQQLEEILMKELHLGKNMSQLMRATSPFFESQKINCSKLWMFSQKPVHISNFVNLLKKYRDNKKILNSKYSKKKNTTLEEDSIILLKKLGYEINKPLSFDEKKFKSDYPELYKKYLIYEKI